MNEQLERNKKAAMAFYGLMFNQCQPWQAIERQAERCEGDEFVPGAKRNGER